MLASPKALWDNSLLLIKDNVSEQQYNTWFKPIVFEWSQKLNERNVEFLCRSYEDVSCTENDFIYKKHVRKMRGLQPRI